MRLTSLAYAMNLRACVPGPSEHLEKRAFSQVLYEELSGGMDQARPDLSADQAFLYLESVVRGVMASWCFSNRDFHIEREGIRCLELAVESVFPASFSDEDPPAPR